MQRKDKDKIPLLSSPKSPASHFREPCEVRKWVVLVLASVLLFGNYYAFDNPSALDTQLRVYMNRSYDVYQYEYGLLYSVYSFPNCFLPFFGGWLIDRIGQSTALLAFSALVCGGQAVFALGTSARNFPIMILGRAIFGMGGESLSVVQSSIVGHWFNKGLLGFALGVTLSFGRLGSVVNDAVTPVIAEDDGVPAAAWFGFFICLVSFVCAIVLSVVNRQSPMLVEARTRARQAAAAASAEASDGTQTLPAAAAGPLATDSAVPVAARAAAGGALADSSSDPHRISMPMQAAGDAESAAYLAPGMASASLSASSDSAASAVADVGADSDSGGGSMQHAGALADADESKQALRSKDGAASDAASEDDAAGAASEGELSAELPTLSDIKLFSRSFWLVCGICVCLYGTVIPFHSVASDFLQDRWYHDDATQAGRVLGIPDTISAVAAPFFGLAIDHFGARGRVMLVCSAVLAVVHGSLGALTITPIPALVVLGFGYALYSSAIWPSVAYVVPAKRLGLAYGTSTSALNLSLSVFPFAVAGIRNAGTWSEVEFFFASLALVAVALCAWLNVEDARHNGGNLNRRKAKMQ